MRSNPLAKRYARALFELAEKTKNSEHLLMELRSFETFLKTDGRLKAYLFSPEVDKKLKVQLLDELLKGKVSELVHNFIVLLMQKGRQQIFSEIIFAFDRLCDQRAGRIRASVITAIPIGAGDLKLMQMRLEQYLRAQVICENIVDPDIFGGLIIKVEGKVIDGSLRHQIDALRRKLYQVKYSVSSL